LIHRAALRCTKIGVPAKFTFVGDVSEVIDDVQDTTCCVFTGEITEPDQLDRLYDEADVLILTSSREGFPLAVMEAMAHGVVPVATSVGGIPAHVQHKVNGMLITEDGEDAIIDSVVGILRELSSNRPLLRKLSCAAYEYAREHFGPSKFCAAYRQLILGSDEKGAAKHNLLPGSQPASGFEV
jgi:glycosyltransferase involved in cell wall biosynthesis